MKTVKKFSGLVHHDGAPNYYVSTREGKHCEFKEVFEKAQIPKYVKTLAAFANTDGGTLIFGVAEKPRKHLVGIDLSIFPDEADWSNNLAKFFDPEIPIQIHEYDVDGKKFATISVSKHPYRPVICKSNGTVPRTKKGKTENVSVMQEGAIFFRYTGRTAAIRFAELDALMQERDDQRLQSLKENLEIMEKIGQDRIGIVDVSKQQAPGDQTSLYVSKSTAKSLTFIDRAKIVEDEAAPAYVVAGTVQLNEVVTAPVGDDEKNMPAEAAKTIAPVVKEIFGGDVKFTASHLSKLAKGLGIRKDGEENYRYFVEEKKLGRSYYTNEGVQFLVDKINADSETCVQLFAPKAIQNRFLAQIAEEDNQ